MEPGNPEPLHGIGTGSQTIRMAVPVPVVSPPQPHLVLSSYGLITSCVVDKEIVFQMCIIDDGTRVGVGVSEKTQVCLSTRNRHQVANDT